MLKKLVVDQAFLYIKAQKHKLFIATRDTTSMSQLRLLVYTHTRPLLHTAKKALSDLPVEATYTSFRDVPVVTLLRANPYDVGMIGSEDLLVSEEFTNYDMPTVQINRGTPFGSDIRFSSHLGSEVALANHAYTSVEAWRYAYDLLLGKTTVERLQAFTCARDQLETESIVGLLRGGPCIKEMDSIEVFLRAEIARFEKQLLEFASDGEYKRAKSAYNNALANLTLTPLVGQPRNSPA